MKGGAVLIEPTEFGRFLKEKRKAAGLTQDDVAAAINKTGQYISNIEKGKNNAPPNSADIEAIIRALSLDDAESKECRILAAADRNQLSSEQMAYLLNHKTLLALIDFGIENEIKDSRWSDVFSIISSSGSF